MIKKIQLIINDFYKHLKEEVYFDLKKSNNKIHTIIKHKNIISGVFAISTMIFGTVGYLIEGQHLFQSILDSIMMFGLNFPKDFGSNIFLFIAGISASITIFLLAVVFFIKDFFEKKLVKDMFKKEHTAIFGLGEINRSFLNSIKDNNQIASIVIIESDSSNMYLEDYRQRGFGVYIGDVFNPKNLELLNFNMMKNAIIALGEDRHNIEFSKIILDDYKENTELKLVVHIQNKDLEILFHSKFIKKNDNQIHIKTFSFYEEVAKDLFSKHFVDGDTTKYIYNGDEFNTIVLGDGQLIEKILYQIALISHLPKENKHTVYIVDKEADKLLTKIKKALYYKKEKNSFTSLEIQAINLDQVSLEFYSDNIWHIENLVNVIVAFDEEKKNLDVAVELYNRTYLQKSIDNNDMPKILFGMYDELLLSGMININKDEFNNFCTYGNVNDILSYNELIDEETDQIAKLINSGYGDEYDNKKLNQDINTLNNKWYNTAKFSDKLSSLAQAKHIDMKLKSMGLKRIKHETNNCDKKILLKSNQKLIFEKIQKDRKEVGLDENSLITYSKELEKFWSNQEYKICYFPEKFDTLFEEMIRMEHNRWNAYHYLNGWKYATEKVKSKKEHDCLVPLKDFDKDSIKITIIYDIYAFLYLPNYLTEAGYEIISYEKKEK